MSYNIIQRDSQILLEGIHFITSLYPEYDPEKFMDRVSGNKYSIEMVLQSIRKFVPVEDFFGYGYFRLSDRKYRQASE